MADPEQPPPRTLIQSGGKAAEQLASGLSTQPMLIAVVALNVAMIVATAWFLSKQEETRAKTITQVTELLTLCFGRLPDPNHRPAPMSERPIRANKEGIAP